MRQKRESAGQRIQDFRRATRRHYSAEEKIRILLEGYPAKANPIVRSMGFSADTIFQ